MSKRVQGGKRGSGNPKPYGRLEQILRAAGRGGYVEVTSHFKMRGAQRGFLPVDALNVLRSGVIQWPPEYCADFCNWKFVVAGRHDYGSLYIVAAVSAGEQIDVSSPTVVLVTGFVR